MKRALWFGPPERSLFGFVTVPDDGRARGAVVVCPPMGMEGECARRRTLDTLAEELAADGILTLRFDYDGTGDSVGREEDPDRVASWLRGVDHAVAFVRSAGAPSVAVVGMRLGATLAAAAVAKRAPPPTERPSTDSCCGIRVRRVGPTSTPSGRCMH